MQDLNHPNIVKIHELINDDTQNKEYLIMEFCDSQSLNDFVNENGGLLNENITKIVLQ
jgi:serine/threonine-protein kinase ULK/ATG1/calcium-dependent protein kinase